MITNPLHRGIINYLRREYGLRVLAPKYGGNHPYLEFEYPIGHQRRITLHGASPHPNALAIKLGDIRRELGPPPLKPEKTRKRIEDMVPQPFNPPRILPAVTSEVKPKIESETRQMPDITGYVACYNYNNKSRLKINVPAKIVTGWEGGGVGVNSIDEDTWELQVDPKVHRRWTKGDQVNLVKIDILLSSRIDPFGISPATIVADAGHMLVTCRKEDRKSVAPPIKKSRNQDLRPLVPVTNVAPMRAARDPETLVAEVRAAYPAEFAKERANLQAHRVRAVSIAEQAYIDKVVSLSARDRMLAVLSEIAALEDETDRRLVQVKGDGDAMHWEWRSDPVRL